VKVHFTKEKGKHNYKVKMMTRYGAKLNNEAITKGNDRIETSKQNKNIFMN